MVVVELAETEVVEAEAEEVVVVAATVVVDVEPVTAEHWATGLVSLPVGQ